MRLEIQQQFGLIQVNSQLPQLKMQTAAPRIDLSVQRARLNIQQQNGDLVIDQSPSRASLGIKDIAASNQDFAAEGRQKALEGIARIASEGDAMMRIEQKGDPIPMIAEGKLEPNASEVNLALITPPIIQYQPKPVTINATENSIDLQFNRGNVHFQYQRGTAEVELVRRPSIQFLFREI